MSLRIPYGHVLVLFFSVAPALAELVIRNPAASDAIGIQWAKGNSLVYSKSRRGEIKVWQVSDGSLVRSLVPGKAMNPEIQIEEDIGLRVTVERGGHVEVTDGVTGKSLWKSESSGFLQARLTEDSDCKEFDYKEFAFCGRPLKEPMGRDPRAGKCGLALDQAIPARPHAPCMATKLPLHRLGACESA